MKVAILGASDKLDRYSYKALQMLKEYGHEVFPINPVKDYIDGIKVYKSSGDIETEIDVLTLYIGSERLGALTDEIIALKPKTVIFNPGTENHDVMTTLTSAGITTIEACTLVLLRTGQFTAIV